MIEGFRGGVCGLCHMERTNLSLIVYTKKYKNLRLGSEPHEFGGEGGGPSFISRGLPDEGQSGPYYLCRQSQTAEEAGPVLLLQCQGPFP
ncbi:hypothetical protein D3C75_1237000 [compost metagenome]